MEDYEYRVINLHATQSQNSSELTGNISKNTSKFTSKTDQIRLVGGPWGGLPLYEPPPRPYVAPIPCLKAFRFRLLEELEADS